MVVGVGFAVGDGVELVEGLAPAALEDACQQFVLGGVVAGRPQEGDTVVGVVAQAHAVAVGLQPMVAGAFFAGRVWGDAGKKAAGWVAGDHVRTDIGIEPVTVVQHAGLDAVPFFIVHAVCLAAYVVRDAGCRHQVAFVRCIDKHFTAVGIAVEHADFGDARTVFGDAGFAVQPLVAVYGDAFFFHPFIKNLLGHVGLENPHSPLVAIHCRCALADVAIFFTRLPCPRFVLLVMLPHPVVKLPRHPADGVGVAGVGPAESAAGEPAQVLVGTDEDDGFAQPTGLHRRDDAGGCAAVNDQVGFMSRRGFLGRGTAEGEEEEEEKEAHIFIGARGEEEYRISSREFPISRVCEISIVVYLVPN